MRGRTLDRVGRYARGQAEDLAVRLRVIPYRPHVRADAARWDEEHASDVAATEYAPLVELARYSILGGWVRWLGPGVTILDLGCGDGILRERLAGTGFSSYLGMDFAAAAIERARRFEDDHTSFAVGELPESPSAPYDVVICNENLECVPNPARYLDRVVEQVRPGGHLLVSLWRHPGDVGLHRLLDERFQLVDAVAARNLTSFRSRRWRLSCHRRV